VSHGEAAEAWRWIDNNADLQRVVDAAAEAPFIAIDTEFRRRDTFYPEVALLQVATDAATWLIDPLAVDDVTALRTLLAGGDRPRVLHSASEDLEVFERWLGCLPTPMVDTQKAAAMLGLGFGLGYRSLVALLLDIDLSKEETQSDWLARPLTPAQCQYAAQDVIHLARCWPLLKAQAEGRGILPWIFEESAAMSTGGKGPLARFKSAWKLRPREQVILAALVEWREGEAKSRDKPRNWVLQDKVISALARKRPSSLPQLGAIEGMPSGLVRRNGDLLLEIIATSEEGPLPPLPRPAGPDAKALARELVPELTTIATGLGMSPEILMSVRDLEALVEHTTGTANTASSQWSGWRHEAVVVPLQQRITALAGG
jgi:ribonuclease D